MFIQSVRNLRSGEVLIDEAVVYLANHLHLFWWTGNIKDTIRIDALSFSEQQNALRYTVTADEQSPQSIARRAPELVAVHRNSALPGKCFMGKFAQVFSRHGPFQRLDESHRYAVVFIVERFGTVVDSNARLLAQKLVVGAFVGVLEAPPATHVIHQNRFISGARAQHVLQQLSQVGPASQIKTASSRVGVGADDLEAVLPRILSDCGLLVFNGVLLVSVDILTY